MTNAPYFHNPKIEEEEEEKMPQREEYMSTFYISANGYRVSSKAALISHKCNQNFINVRGKMIFVCTSILVLITYIQKDFCVFGVSFFSIFCH